MVGSTGIDFAFKGSITSAPKVLNFSFPALYILKILYVKKLSKIIDLYDFQKFIS